MRKYHQRRTNNHEVNLQSANCNTSSSKYLPNNMQSRINITSLSSINHELREEYSEDLHSGCCKPKHHPYNRPLMRYSAMANFHLAPRPPQNEYDLSTYDSVYLRDEETISIRKILGNKQKKILLNTHFRSSLSFLNNQFIEKNIYFKIYLNCIPTER